MGWIVAGIMLGLVWGTAYPQTWNAVTSGTTQDLNGVYFTSTSTGFIVGNTGTIRKSTDGGLNWTSTTSPITNDLTDVYFADAFMGYACGTNGRVIRTSNAGVAWSLLTSLPTSQTLNGIRSRVFSGSYAILTVGNSGTIYVSPNNGGNWSPATSGTSANLYDAEMGSNVLNAWVVGASGTILATTDGGGTWNPQTSGTANALRGVFFTSLTQGWAVGDNGTILTTSNGGTTWTAQTSGTTQQLNDVYFVSATAGWAVGNNGTILGTMNGGLTWTAQTSNTSAHLNACHIPISCRGISAGATGTIRRFEFIPSQPTAISGSTNVCAATSQTYTIPAVIGATSYTWSLPAGWTGTSTSTSINVTTGSTGGTISVVANGDCGASSPRTLVVTVTTIPAQPGSITGSTSTCNNVAQSYSVAAVSGATSYTWSLPAGWGGTSSLSTINATSGTSGGVITVTANNGCGSSTAQTLTVTVNNAPAQPGAITGNTTVCPGSSETYSIPSVNGATDYTWSLPAGWSGSSSTTALVCTTGASAGTIYVTANNACGSSPAQSLAVSQGSAPPQPSGIIGSTNLCFGAVEDYSIIPVPGATSYTWLLPAGWNGSSTSSSITTIAGPSSGTITVMAENGCGTSPGQDLFVTIEQAPAQPGSISGAFVLCPGSGDVYAVAAVNGATSYTWILPSGWTGASTTNSIMANCGTSGTIQVTADNACGNSAPQTLQVNVLAAPDVTVTLTGGELTAVQNGATYQWLDCNGFTPIAGETAQSYEPAVTGDYAVIVTLNGCSDTSVCTNVDFSGLSTLTEGKSFSIFPNPSQGEFTIQGASGIAQIEISNMLGERVYLSTSESNELVVKLWTALSPGIYCVRINGSSEAQRIVVE